MRDYSRINRFLELPREVVSDVPKITITGFDEVLIENFKGILEYENFFVRVSTDIGNININGFNLKLNQMADTDILVSGKIENIDFENKKMS
jgi:sporulation protein YqfC